MPTTRAQAANTHFKKVHELLAYLSACVKVADWERTSEEYLNREYCEEADGRTPDQLMTEEEVDAEDEATAAENDELYEWYQQERFEEWMYIVRDAEKTPLENMMQYLGDITRDMMHELISEIDKHNLMTNEDKDTLKKLSSTVKEKAIYLSQLGEIKTLSQVSDMEARSRR